MAKSFLQPPSWNHWFGTDLAGKDVFQACLIATVLELITLVVVAVMLHTLTLVVAGLFGVSSNRWIRTALPQATHLWSTLPHLLLVTLIVVLIGPGQLQLMVSMLVTLLAAHVMFTLSVLGSRASRLHYRQIGIGFAAYPYIGARCGHLGASQAPAIHPRPVAGDRNAASGP
ncbi:hypothetical protein [Methyloglobulus sp.]|uniref:hypothetical protein n=1 Tax=Methyloglobulus sp. TaxID=2518622 RepID=UPI0039897603